MRPNDEHPKRPIEGYACLRREVSGQRLWGWAREMKRALTAMGIGVRR
jgi:hypothetical protein